MYNDYNFSGSIDKSQILDWDTKTRNESIKQSYIGNACLSQRRFAEWLYRCETCCLLSKEAQVPFLRILCWLANLDKGVIESVLSKPIHRFLGDVHSKINQAFKRVEFVINL